MALARGAPRRVRWRPVEPTLVAMPQELSRWTRRCPLCCMRRAAAAAARTRGWRPWRTPRWGTHRASRRPSGPALPTCSPAHQTPGWACQRRTPRWATCVLTLPLHLRLSLRDRPPTRGTWQGIAICRRCRRAARARLPPLPAGMQPQAQVQCWGLRHTAASTGRRPPRQAGAAGLRQATEIAREAEVRQSAGTSSARLRSLCRSGSWTGRTAAGVQAPGATQAPSSMVTLRPPHSLRTLVMV